MLGAGGGNIGGSNNRIMLILLKKGRMKEKNIINYQNSRLNLSLFM